MSQLIGVYSSGMTRYQVAQVGACCVMGLIPGYFIFEVLFLRWYKRWFHTGVLWWLLSFEKES